MPQRQILSQDPEPVYRAGCVGRCIYEQRRDRHSLPGLFSLYLPLKQGSQLHAGGGGTKTHLVALGSELEEGRV